MIKHFSFKSKSPRWFFNIKEASISSDMDIVKFQLMYRAKGVLTSYVLEFYAKAWSEDSKNEIVTISVDTSIVSDDILKKLDYLQQEENVKKIILESESRQPAKIDFDKLTTPNHDT